MSSNPPNEKSLAQQAIELLKQNNVGTLSTHSVKHDGFPFASLTNYSINSDGQPIFFFSSMATHSKNIRANAKAALLVSESNTSSDMASGRLTLMGSVIPISPDAHGFDEVREAYLRSNPDAAQWISFGDFQFYRLALIDIYFVAGFGVMGWVSPEDFAAAAK
jgi:putative heme iron utilization protein